MSRQARDVPLMEEEEQTQPYQEDAAGGAATATPLAFNTTGGSMGDAVVNGSQAEEAEPQSSWLNQTEPPHAEEDEEFVNAVVSDYEDSNEPGSGMVVPAEPAVLLTRPPPILLELRWLPPRPPTSYNGFVVYVYRDGKEPAAFSPVCQSGRERRQATPPFQVKCVMTSQMEASKPVCGLKTCSSER